MLKESKKQKEAMEQRALKKAWAAKRMEYILNAESDSEPENDPLEKYVNRVVIGLNRAVIGNNEMLKYCREPSPPSSPGSPVLRLSQPKKAPTAKGGKGKRYNRV